MPGRHRCTARDCRLSAPRQIPNAPLGRDGDMSFTSHDSDVAVHDRVHPRHDS